MNGKYIAISMALIATLSNVWAQDKPEYSIQVAVKGLGDTTLLLSHRYGDKFYSDDTLRLNAHGEGSFEGSGKLDQGMYQIVFPDKSFLDFFVDDDQFFTLQTTHGDYLNTNQAIGHTNNQLFFDWHRASQKLRKSPEMNTVWDTTLQRAGSSLLGKFLTALRPFQVPDSVMTPDFKNSQLAQYHYYKNNFFNSVDFSDARLLRTPIFQNKLNQFFEKITPPQPDSVIFYVDEVLARASEDPMIFQFCLQHLFNYYSEPKLMGMDAVYVYLAENYYFKEKAPWVDASNMQQIKTRVSALSPLLIGKKAPMLKGLQTPEGEIVDLFEAKNKWKVLYFWEPDCGHCKKSTPELFTVYEDLKSLDAEIYAINTRLDKEKWTSFIAENELTWVNLYSPLQVRDLLESYQAWSTPLLFILDENNTIIAKGLTVSQVKDYFTFLSGQSN